MHEIQVDFSAHMYIRSYVHKLCQVVYLFTAFAHTWLLTWTKNESSKIASLFLLFSTAKASNAAPQPVQ